MANDLKSYTNFIMLTISALFISVADSRSQENELRLGGHVVDSLSQLPLRGVNIVLLGENRGTVTDSMGYFEIFLSRSRQHRVVFSHLAYKKQEIDLTGNEVFDGDVWIELPEVSIPLDVVTVQGERIINEVYATFKIGSEDIKKVGEIDMERTMMYLLPSVIRPIHNRLSEDEDDFTLYVDGEWMESLFLNDIPPAIVKRVLVWERWGNSPDLQHDTFPIGMPLRRGKYVVLIETNKTQH